MMHPRIRNADLDYSKAKLVEPTLLGYIYISAAVHPGPVSVILPSAKRARLLARLKEMAREIKRLDEPIQATVFRTIVIPPTLLFNPYLKERRSAIHVPDFDVALLAQTISPETARTVLTTEPFPAGGRKIRLRDCELGSMGH